MLERILRVPVEDADLARKGRLVGILALAAIGAVVGIYVLFFMIGVTCSVSGEVTVALLIPLATAVGILVAWGLAKGGHVRAGIWLTMIVQYVGTAVAVVLFDGYRSAAQLNFVAQIIFAGMLLGSRGAFWYGGLSSLFMMAVLLAEKSGLYTPMLSDPEVRVLTYFGFTQISFFLTGVMSFVALRSLERTWARAEELVEELEQQRSTLEEVVSKRTADLERRAVYMEAAAQVARDAAAIRDIDSLLDATVRLISDRFGFYHAGIFLVDDRNEYAVLRAASSEGGRRMLERGHRLRIGEEGIVGYVAARGEPRVASEVGDDLAFFDNPILPETRSEMALPLLVRGRVIGVLDVQSREPGAFSDEDVAVLQTLADQVALAIENARLLEEAGARLRELDFLLGRQSEEGWRRIVEEQPGWGYVYNGLNVVPREKVAGEPEVPSQLTVPLRVRGRTIGRLELAFGEQRPLAPDASALVEDVVEQAMMALESARMFRETQRALRNTEALYRAGQAMGAASSPIEVERALVEYAAGSGVDAVRVLIVEYDEHGQPTHVALSEGWRSDKQPIQDYGMRLSLQDRQLMQSMTGGKLVVVEDVLTDSRVNDEIRTLIVARAGLRSFVIVPISVGERVIGALFVGRRRPSKFSPELVRGYEALAGQAAVALESLRLLDETRRRAEREGLISSISARMRATLDVETVLQTAAQEIGERLGLAELVVRVGVDEGAD